MKKMMMATAIGAGMFSLFAETDEIGKAVAATFAGKTAVITGAASGMGLCTAKTLAEAGATVFLCDINGAGVHKAADEINAWGKGKAHAVEADVRKFADAERIDKLVEMVRDEPGGTWTDKFVSYARSCGILKAEIAHFRNIMLEDGR